jgi:hypothetical protein
MDNIEDLNKKFDKIIELLQQSNFKQPVPKSNMFINILTSIISALIIAMFTFVWSEHIKLETLQVKVDNMERLRIKGLKSIDYNFKILNVDGKYILTIYDPDDKSN